MLYSDRLDIFNPGDLTPKLNVTKLKKEHGSFPTNPKLAELMYQAGYIERYGTGTREIFKLAKDAKLKEPEFDFASGFEITIWRPTSQSPRSVPNQYRTSTVPVPHQYRTSQEICNLVSMMEGEMTRTELQGKLALRHKATFLKNYLQPAIAESVIELTIPDKPNSPKQTYRLTEKGLELQMALKNK